MFRRILLASDLSLASAPAFAKALELAKADRAELIVTHVRVPVVPVAIDGHISPKACADIEAAARRELRKRLATLVGKAKRCSSSGPTGGPDSAGWSSAAWPLA